MTLMGHASDMPFIVTADSNDGDRPLVRLRVVSPTRFQVRTGFYYRDHGGTKHKVPAHIGTSPYTDENSTDLATVPPLLWGILASYGRQTLPALLHDHLCVEAAKLKGRVGFGKRAEADALFRNALAEEGVEWFRRWLFWAGVSVGRYGSHAKVRFVLLLGHVAIAMAAIVLSLFARFTSSEQFLRVMPASVRPLLDPAKWPSVAVSWQPTIVIYVLSGLLLAAAAFWGSDWRLVAIGASVGPIVLVALTLTGLVALLLRSPDMAIWVGRRIHHVIGGPEPGPFPFPKPTRVEPGANGEDR